MVEIAGSPISRPARARLAVFAAVAAVAAASLALPLVGVPPALGVAGYLTIRLSKPNQVRRGRVLSAAQQRRAAIVVGSAVFGIAALFSGSIAGLDLAARLESRLHDQLETFGATLKLGDTRWECEKFACASATVIKPATDKTLGIAELHGFALNEMHAYGWRQRAQQSSEERRTEPSRVP